MKKDYQGFGILLIGLAFMAFGVDHFVFQTFVTGRPPAWPANLSGEHFASYVSGVLFFASGVTILMRRGWHFPFAAGILVLLWCAARNMYELIAHLDYGILLTQTNKSLTIGGCALAMAALINPKPEGLRGKTLTLEKYFLGIFLFTAGIQHFIFAEFVQHLVPSWIPFPLWWTYFAGIALCAGGLGLITGIKSQLAAMLAAYMVFIWVFVLHIPRALSFNNANEWTAVAEATLVSGMLFVIAGRESKY